jgi:hypothetical protein
MGQGEIEDETYAVDGGLSAWSLRSMDLRREKGYCCSQKMHRDGRVDEGMKA